MSLKLPLQSKAIRPKFQSKKVIFGDDDDDEEHVQDELVVGFEDNKLKEVKPKEKKKLLSINPLPNADWRKVAKQKKELYIPAQALQRDRPGQIQEEKDITYGLTIQKKTENEDIQEIITTDIIQETVQEDTIVEEVEEKTKTLEERAVEAIIRDSMGDHDESEEGGPKRVIHVDETLAFRDDVKSRPDETTMEDYDNIPVEEFGAALLRGLGWNEGEGIGRNRKAGAAPAIQTVKQRDALLGLGAKPEDISKEKKFQHKKAAYTFKDTSLFKKIAKKKLNDDDSEKEYRSSSSRASSSSGESSRSHRHDVDNRSDGKDRRDRYSRSDRDRSDRDRSDRDRSDRDGGDRDRKRSRSRSSDRHRTKSTSSSSKSHRRRSRSRSPDRHSSSSSSKRRK